MTLPTVDNLCIIRAPWTRSPAACSPHLTRERQPPCVATRPSPEFVSTDRRTRGDCHRRGCLGEQQQLGRSILPLGRTDGRPLGRLPEEHGAPDGLVPRGRVRRLLLADRHKGKLDVKKGAYKGPLGKTGVDLEIRAGGPFIGQQTVQSLMYQDDSITLGLVHTDDAVRFSKQLPTVSVVAPLEHSPLALVWDPTKHNFNSWKESASRARRSSSSRRPSTTCRT